MPIVLGNLLNGLKCEPGGSRICLRMKFEAMSGSIDSADLKTDTIFLLNVNLN